MIDNSYDCKLYMVNYHSKCLMNRIYSAIGNRTPIKSTPIKSSPIICTP